MNINEIKPNPSNPRIIKDDKFHKLVESVKTFPEMLSLRPIVIDENNVVLGGNMRLKACRAAGITDVPVLVATNLTEEQKKEFIIKDNASGGEWDWDMLANEWDAFQLDEWGIDLPVFSADADGEGDEGKPLDNYIIKYELVFDNEGQQDKWYTFLKTLKDKYIECDTIAERLEKFLEENKLI